MSSYTISFDLPDYKVGDRWPGVPVIGPITINGVQPENALTRIRMHFVHPSGRRYRLDSDAGAERDAPITITNATTWQAQIPEIQNFLPLDETWSWDMEFYEEGNTGPLTFYEGSINVTPSIT